MLKRHKPRKAFLASLPERLQATTTKTQTFQNCQNAVGSVKISIVPIYRINTFKPGLTTYWDNCIQNFYIRRCIAGYTVGNIVSRDKT